jgi:phytoene/squalene synthetase
MDAHRFSDPALAARITRAASKQTYFTIRLLVDHDRVDDAFRAYAYFRWVDDWLDIETRTRSQRSAFIQRQQSLIDACYRGETQLQVSPEEMLLVELIGTNREARGLEKYIRGMMQVMTFDAARRGRLISKSELEEYIFSLSSAVTEAMHYFIGHDDPSPCDDTRYEAVKGAHITHLLRDTLEDIEAGYFNLPRELANRSAYGPELVSTPFYRRWVKENVTRARECFKMGRKYMSRVQNLRCRIAGYAYMYRFEVVLRAIENERYCLRPCYPERKTGLCLTCMVAWAFWMALTHHTAIPA